MNVQMTISFQKWKSKNHVFLVYMIVNNNFFNEICVNFLFQKLNTSLWFATPILR
jgi:hypothetical protein